MWSVSWKRTSARPRTEPAVTDGRRRVRVAKEVFDTIDDTFGEERVPNGEPSVNDFLSIELFSIADAFADRFEDLPEFIDGRGDVRLLVAAGTLVPVVAVLGRVDPDGSIELIWIRFDLGEEER